MSGSEEVGCMCVRERGAVSEKVISLDLIWTLFQISKDDKGSFLDGRGNAYP